MQGRNTLEDDMWPSIDHSLLSPSGHMSKRARDAAMKRETERLFAGVDLTPTQPKQPTKSESLRRQAAELRTLAARGMCVRKYPRLAAAMEAEADRLEQAR